MYKLINDSVGGLASRRTDFGRFAKHQDAMTYVLVSSRKIPSEGFTDLKQDFLLDDHDCRHYELSEELLEELTALSK